MYLSTANFLSILSRSEFSCLLTAEWIVEWKHRNGCFPMWCRFRSFTVCSVDLLHYREHMDLLRVSGRRTPLALCLLICVELVSLDMCLSLIPLSFIQNLAPDRFVFQIISPLLVLVCFNCYFIICSAIFGATFYIVCYILCSRFHIGGEGK